jgi:hypothetical protein
MTGISCAIALAGTGKTITILTPFTTSAVLGSACAHISCFPTHLYGCVTTHHRRHCRVPAQDNDGESANACRDGRCTWHNQTDGTPMIDTLKFPDLKGLVAYGHSLSLQVGFYLNNCICMEKGRTYFAEDVAFMHEMQFDTVKIVSVPQFR